MACSNRVHVMQCLHHLSEVEACDRLREVLKSHEVEQFASIDKFENDVSNFFLNTIRLLFNTIHVCFEEAHDVGVIHHLVDLDFLLEVVEGLSCESWVGQIEDFDGILLTLFVLTELDFGRGS